jgi:2-polyprenyl-6-hydroxyphenyl methylase/3-demethylubiquinone-9 3-methyltransferase
MSTARSKSELDHSSDSRFRAYYEEKSASAPMRQHFVRLRDKVLRMRAGQGGTVEQLRVLDIGCNAGSQALVWAEKGHRVTGLDVNEPLLVVARERAQAARFDIRFDLGTATSLPYEDGSVDVCMMLELLEHVQDWESCVNEAVRVLAPGGVLYLSTTNALCPKQQEFNLPLYSWYPAALKKHFEKLSVTTRPELVNFARYPAVHWFTYSDLRCYLEKRAMRCFDRFDLLDTSGSGWPARSAVAALRRLPPLRWFGHVLTPGTSVMAVKQVQGSATVV